MKTFVDANIQINPPTATNPINTTHTFTAHVYVNDGRGAGFVNAPNGTVITFAIVGGTSARSVPGNQCTIASGTGTLHGRHDLGEPG